MKPFLLLLLVGGAALAQPFSAGLKGGLPLTDFLNTVEGSSTTTTNRYLFGPEVEVRLPLGLSVEFDALYRHFSYTNVLGSVIDSITSVGSSGNWEFPLVVKYKFPSGIVRPYVEAGVAWDTLSGLKNTATTAVCGSGAFCPANSSSVVIAPPTASSKGTMGVVLGGGIDIHAVIIHVAPEIRFTRWAQEYFNLSGVLNSGKNQAEVLVGFTF
ncbi:MAG: outer membrane beta-barrel protein [Bryobacteraceae bacterium]